MTTPPREGLRIDGQRGDPEVRAAFVRFAAWLRQEFAFPARLTVHLSAALELRTPTGETASSTFSAPLDPEEEPAIHIATGDFAARLAADDRIDVLASYLYDFAYQITLYQRWFQDRVDWDDEASAEARALLKRYAGAVGEP